MFDITAITSTKHKKISFILHTIISGHQDALVVDGHLKNSTHHALVVVVDGHLRDRAHHAALHIKFLYHLNTLQDT